MWETDGFKKIIKETKFKDIVESKYISNFPQEFFGMRSKMKELELINDDEYKYLGYAHNANKSSEIGRYIKNGLYDFILTGKCNEEHVNSICKNSKKNGEPLTLESLQELCIKTINVKEIKISNKRNDD
jgi:hypothetical protein